MRYFQMYSLTVWRRCVHKQVAILADRPDRHLQQWLLILAVVRHQQRSPQLERDVRLIGRRTARNQLDRRRYNVVAHVITDGHQNAELRVQVPAHVRCVSFGGQNHAAAARGLELRIGFLQEYL